MSTLSFVQRAKAQSAKPKKCTIEEGFDVYIRSLSMQRFKELSQLFKASAEVVEAKTKVEGSDQEVEMSAEQMTAVATLLTETICEEDGTPAMQTVDEAKELINTLSISLMSLLVKSVMKVNGGDVGNDDSFRGRPG